MKYLFILSLLAFWVSVGDKALAQSSAGTGNEFLQSCTAIRTPNRATGFPEGFCLGVVATVNFFANGSVYCAPANATIGQMTLVAVVYMERNPQKLHEPLPTLVITALSEAFPCSGSMNQPQR